MPSGNGNNGSGVRDKNGFTEKQRLALPVIAQAKTKAQGVEECERLGIMRADTYYKHWTKQPHFVNALKELREQFFQDVLSDVKHVFRESAVELAGRLVDAAKQSSSDRDRIIAIAKVLSALGVDFGTGTKVNVQQSTTLVTEKQVEFKDRIEKLAEDRLARITSDD